MTNFLEETKRKLKDNGVATTDVEFISDGKCFMLWEDFEKIADFNYDSGYGTAEINDFLVVVGRDWWMERHEYDGAEWWEFKVRPHASGLKYNPNFNLKTDW